MDVESSPEQSSKVRQKHCTNEGAEVEDNCSITCKKASFLWSQGERLVQLVADFTGRNT